MNRSAASLVSRTLGVEISTALLSALLLVAGAHTVRAAGVVTTCDEAHLDTALSGGGLVTFNCGGAATITVTGTKTISADTTIDGGNQNLITISGGNSVGVFSVHTGVNFTVQNLTIANGNSAFGGGIANGGINGGGGTVTVTNSIFSDNIASDNNGCCGAIVTSGTLTVTNSTFSGNNTAAGAGAIGNLGTLTITNSTFSNNKAAGNNSAGGGAIGNRGTLTVTNSTFVDNSASTSDGGGGGIDSDDGMVTVTNSTFIGNSASNGDSRGGGISTDGGTLTVTNTIVANNAGGNCDSGGVTDGGHNIDDDGTCGFSTGSTHPQLDPAGLKSNGGPTQTIALQMGSPAIDAGDETVCSMPPVNNLDQRGYGRPGGSATSCSIGAYEYNAVPASPSLTSAITATDTCIPVSDTSIFSPMGGFALIGTELISYTGLDTSCSGASAARTSAGTAATAGVLTGVVRNLNGQGGAHPAGTTVTPTAGPSACVGDCNGSGQVTVNEIIVLVNIALGSADPAACADGIPSGSQVNVALIIQAVNNALDGCGG